jgi:hypothetical protein
MGEGLRGIVRARTLGSPPSANGERGMAVGQAWPVGAATGPAPTVPTGSVRARHLWPVATADSAKADPRRC